MSGVANTFKNVANDVENSVDAASPVKSGGGGNDTIRS